MAFDNPDGKTPETMVSHESPVANQAGRHAKPQTATKGGHPLGMKYMTINGANSSETMSLHYWGIEFICPDNGMEPMQRSFFEIKLVTLENGESLQERVTLTRLVLFGVFALALTKKKGGTKFIVVEGDDFLWAMEVGRKNVGEVQRFVMKARSLIRRK